MGPTLFFKNQSILAKTNFMNNLIKKSIREYQKKQDLIYNLQKLSNQIRAKSKKVIALLRRDNIKEGKKIIIEIENIIKQINKIFKKNKSLIGQNSYKEGIEEYIEAITFFNFLTKSKKRIPNFVRVESEEIVGGICGFTGELVRKAITIASVENLKQLFFYKKVVEKIAEELTKIGFRGKLRQKYDQVERNLKKIENILYDIKLKK